MFEPVEGRRGQVGAEASARSIPRASAAGASRVPALGDMEVDALGLGDRMLYQSLPLILRKNEDSHLSRVATYPSTGRGGGTR